jgi:hypothetical protein
VLYGGEGGEKVCSVESEHEGVVSGIVKIRDSVVSSGTDGTIAMYQLLMQK